MTKKRVPARSSYFSEGWVRHSKFTAKFKLHYFNISHTWLDFQSERIDVDMLTGRTSSLVELLKLNLCGWSYQMFINRENRAVKMIYVPMCRTLTSMCCTTAEGCSRTGCLIGIWRDGCKLCFSSIRQKPRNCNLLSNGVVQLYNWGRHCFCTELKHDCFHLHYWSASKLVPLFHAGLHIHIHTHTYVYCPGE